MGMIATGMDFETTGFLEPEHRIVEAAFVMYDFDTEKVLGKLVRRWNPGRPIDPKASEVHGIRFEDVAHLPTLEADTQGIQFIQRILAASDFIVAHNGTAFDDPFLRQEFRRIAKPLPEFVTVDTMVQGRWATPLGKVPNLGELCFACRVPYDTAAAHSADYDVMVMMQCFFHAAKRGFFTYPQQQLQKAA